MEVSGGGRADNAYTVYVHPPLAAGGGTIDKGYNLYLRKPTSANPTLYWSLYSEGKAEFAGEAKFKGALPGAQNSPGGVYIGQGSNTNPGVEIGDGTSLFRIAHNEAGGLSFELPGQAVLGSLKTSGVFEAKGHLVGGVAATGENATALPSAASTAKGFYAGRNSGGNAALMLASGTILYSISNENNRITFSRPGTAVHLEIDQSGNLITQGGAGIVSQGAGLKLGTDTTQLLGFWNATPVARPAAVADATDATTAITQLNALLARLRTIGLIAP